MSQAAFKGSMADKGGVIINISASLHWNGTALQAHSSAAKAGVDALTKVLACEWGPHNVRVVGIVPGAISGTEGFERLGNIANMNNRDKTDKAFESKSASTQSPDTITSGLIPIMRFGEVEDIANAALYLSSNAAAYVTGVNVVVDGGSFLTLPNTTFGSKDFVNLWQKAKL